MIYISCFYAGRGMDVHGWDDGEAKTNNTSGRYLQIKMGKKTRMDSTLSRLTFIVHLCVSSLFLIGHFSIPCILWTDEA